jgi:ribonucleoside-diphosphate reductase alpha chain
MSKLPVLDLEKKVSVEQGNGQAAGEVISTYTYEEAFAASKEYFNGDELAANVWINKYALKDSAGNIYEKTPDDMHRRLAGEIARVEAKYENPISEEEIYSLLKDFKYIVPQGGPMTGIGNKYQIASLSNCFVIGNNGAADSYGSVMKIDEEQVQLMKRRGGVGHDLTHIRPKGQAVLNSALTSTGVVPFMERYSNSTREVAQDGRRGALMLSISIKHPDAEGFIDAKMDGTKVTGANVSVKIDDEFMRSVKSNSPYNQQFPVQGPARIEKQINANDLWQKIIHNAWKSAEPGVLFWDTIIRESVPDCYADLGFRTVSTNPCGEIPLCPYDSCRLLAVNLYNYVENPFTKGAKFNYEMFDKHSRIALRIMDDIVDLELEKIDMIINKIQNDPEDEEVKRTELTLWRNIRKKCVEGRRTGVGITAEGDMLAALGIRYGTDESLSFSEEVHKRYAISVYGSSVELAKERGCFPIYDTVREEKNPFILRLKEEDEKLYADMVKYGRRNIACLTIAPTGTTSLMTQTTSGIEPVFMISYKRRRKVNPNDKNIKVDFVDEVGDSWEEFNVFHHKFVEWLKLNSYHIEDVSKMADEELQKIIEKSPYAGSTANDVDWVKKVKMQGAVQKWVDHSISVTVNVPEDVDEDLISQIYITGWESGCKGVTVYRDGSRSGVLVNHEEKKDADSADAVHETDAPKRPATIDADIVRFQNNNEKWIAVVGLLKERPYEIFTGRAEDSFMIPSYVEKGYVLKSRDENGKSRYDFQYKDRDGYKITINGLSRSFNKEFWNYAKLLSGVLRHGMPLISVVDMVSDLHLNDETLNTWKAGVVRSLKKYIPDGTVSAKEVCESCGENSLVYEEGCLNCKNCGHSKCG